MQPLQLSKKTMQTDSIKSINIGRVRRKGIEDLLNCAIMIFFSLKLREFCVTQNETAKIVKIVQLNLEFVTKFCRTRQG